MKVEDSKITPVVEDIPFTDRRSEAVEDLMGKVPNNIIRSGTFVLFVIIMLVLLGAYFVKFPDTIKGSVTITLNDPPVFLKSQSSAKIQKLFVDNNQLVNRGDVVCLLENPASFSDVLTLKENMAALDSALLGLKELDQIDFPTNLNLGELQQSYEEFYWGFHQYIFFLEQDIAQKRIQRLTEQIGFYESLDNELKSKEQLLTAQLELQKKNFLIDSLLNRNGVTPDVDFYNSELNFISQKINTNENKFRLLENKIRQSENYSDIFEQSQFAIEKKADLKFKLYQGIRRLEASLTNWEQRFLLKAPVAGKVNFFKFWKENQYVEESEAIMVILPYSQDFICKGLLPLRGAGKVAIGQKVLVKLSAYPYEEFGVIEGLIENVSDMPLEGYYSFQINLTNGLVTNRNKKIISVSQLEGEAEILIDNLSIIQRIFYTILGLKDYQ